MKPLKTKVPKSVLSLLGKGPWPADERARNKFARLLEVHAATDKRDGNTAFYSHDRDGSTSISAKEFAALVADGAIRPEFHRDGWANQHWEHSLEQFFAEATHAWHQHIKRTDALVGTPAGSCWPKAEVQAPLPVWITAMSAAGSKQCNEHEVELATVFLAAQAKAPRAAIKRSFVPLKHVIESACGCYVSEDAVWVAAHALGMPGVYPNFNLLGKLTLPAPSAYAHISRAFTQLNYCESLPQYVEDHFGAGTRETLADLMVGVRRDDEVQA